ncbi:hypothetical protein D7W82_17200 [Corallococcus sp. CA049B]|nr:hypothetical protein D7W82_17200 [Corallococcus sp. CA049B]
MEAPDHHNALGRAWAMRERLLALPDFEAGLIEGRPFLLAIGRNVLSKPVRPLAKEVSDSLLAHARQAIELTRKLQTFDP